MAERSMFFSSTFGKRRRYTAEDIADYWQSFLSTGLISRDKVPLLRVTANGEDNVLNVGVGSAIIKGHLYINDDDLKVDVPLPEGRSERIDRVVLRMDNQKGVDDSQFIKVFIKEGTENAPPELERTYIEGRPVVYELSLAQVKLNEGTSYIIQEDVIDERFDEELCGLTSSLVSVPTNEFKKEWLEFKEMYLDWFNEVQDTSFVDQAELSATKRDIYKELAYTNLKVNARDRVINGTTFGIDGLADFGLDFRTHEMTEFEMIENDKIKLIEFENDEEFLLNKYIILKIGNLFESIKVVGVDSEILTLEKNIVTDNGILFLNSYRKSLGELYPAIKGTFTETSVLDFPDDTEIDYFMIHRINGVLYGFKGSNTGTGVVEIIHAEGITNESFNLPDEGITYVTPYQNNIIYGTKDKTVLYDIEKRKVLDENGEVSFNSLEYSAAYGSGRGNTSNIHRTEDDIFYFVPSNKSNRIYELEVKDGLINYVPIVNSETFSVNLENLRILGIKEGYVYFLSSRRWDRSGFTTSFMHLLRINTLTKNPEIIVESKDFVGGVGSANRQPFFSNVSMTNTHFIGVQEDSIYTQFYSLEYTTEGGNVEVGYPEWEKFHDRISGRPDFTHFKRMVDGRVFYAHARDFMALINEDLSMDILLSNYDIDTLNQFQLSDMEVSKDLYPLPTRTRAVNLFNNNDIEPRVRIEAGLISDVITLTLNLDNNGEFVAFAIAEEEAEVKLATLNGNKMNVVQDGNELQIYGGNPLEVDNNIVNLVIKPKEDSSIKTIIGGYSK